MEGINDIILAIKSVITGTPINLQQYFKDKAVSYTVNLLVAGITTIKEGLSQGVNQLSQKTAEQGSKDALKQGLKEGNAKLISKGIVEQTTKTAFVQTIVTLASPVITEAVTDTDEIREDSRNAINKMLIEQASNLNKIIAADNFDNGGRQNKLYNYALGIVKKISRSI
jgi:hypothetical protein